MRPDSLPLPHVVIIHLAGPVAPGFSFYFMALLSLHSMENSKVFSSLCPSRPGLDAAISVYISIPCWLPHFCSQKPTFINAFFSVSPSELRSASCREVADSLRTQIRS